jgi:hypothetical protein
MLDYDAMMRAARAVLEHLGQRLLFAEMRRAESDRVLSEVLQVDVQSGVDLTRLAATGPTSIGELGIYARATDESGEVAWQWHGTLDRYERLARAIEVFAGPSGDVFADREPASPGSDRS